MMLLKEKKLTIYFGDAQCCRVSHKTESFKDYAHELVKAYNLDQLIFQRQVHGTQGTYVTLHSPNQSHISLFQIEGDFLATDQKSTGIGILTADCLPIVLYDQKDNSVAVVHAGWRGTVENIVAKAVETLLQRHNFQPQDLLAYFGPSALACCYEIQDDLVQQQEGNRMFQQAVIKRSNKLFLDVPAINRTQLIDLGIPPANIITTHNLCTMCNKNFHSYRRQGEASLRQPTIAWID
jgi:hypothetical protein